LMQQKKVMFICVGNSCRSQMAEGFARHLGKDRVEAMSAGTVPAEMVAPKAIEVMAEKGIDISMQMPKMLDLELALSCDRVITMGCDAKDMCPAPLVKRLGEDWGLEDPMGKGIEKYRKVRDLIEKKVQHLLETL